MEWFWLALLCAFTLASADAVTKRWLGRHSIGEIAMIRLGLGGLLLSPALLLQPLPLLPLPFWMWIMVLIPLEILAMLLYTRAIRDHALSLTLPYLAFTPVFVTVTGWLILEETVSGRGLIGVLLVVTGSWILNIAERDKSGWRSLLAPFAAIVRNAGSRWMLLVATIYAFTSVGGKAAMRWLPPEQFGPLYFLLVGTGSILVIGCRRPDALRIFTYKPMNNLIIAALMAAMVITHFMALARVETAYMITVKRTSLLFGILYGAWFFGEKHLLRHFLAGALMVLGVGLILLG